MAKKMLVALVATVAAFAANTGVVNAQGMSEVENRIAQTCDAIKETQKSMSLANQKTYFYDKQALEIEMREAQYEFLEKIRRNAISGWAAGAQVGCIQLAENFSPTLGLGASFTGKTLILGASYEAAISKYNSESDKSGERFISSIFTGKLGIVLTRFPLAGYSNMGLLSLGYEFKYILDRNYNDGSNTIETETEYITTSNYFDVAGSSMCHCGFLEARFSLKHMGVTSLGLKLYGGVFNRYYIDGTRRKAIFGASVSLYFSGAKLRTDKNVTLLRQQLEQLSNLDQTR